jgi:hypothetical protein
LVSHVELCVEVVELRIAGKLFYKFGCKYNIRINKIQVVIGKGVLIAIRIKILQQKNSAIANSNIRQWSENLGFNGHSLMCRQLNSINKMNKY